MKDHCYATPHTWYILSYLIDGSLLFSFLIDLLYFLCCHWKIPKVSDPVVYKCKKVTPYYSIIYH